MGSKTHLCAVEMGGGVGLEGQGEVPHQGAALLVLASIPIAVTSTKTWMSSRPTLTLTDWSI